MRPTFDEYFMSIAEVAATRSTCLRIPSGVGCILVKDKRIVSTGYAGSLRGQRHCTDFGVGCLIDPVAGGCVRTVHAEQNAILQAQCDLRGAHCYTTLSPCWVCTRLLIQAGVARILYRDVYRLGVERELDAAKIAGVEFDQFPKTVSTEP